MRHAHVTFPLPTVISRVIFVSSFSCLSATRVCLFRSYNYSTCTVYTVISRTGILQGSPRTLNAFDSLLLILCMSSFCVNYSLTPRGHLSLAPRHTLVAPRHENELTKITLDITVV